MVTNRLVLPVAGWLPGFAIVLHRGRRSGRLYRTPVNCFRVDGGYRFALTYGPDSDWVRNVVAAGGVDIASRGHLLTLTDPRPGTDPGARWAPWPARPVLRRIRAGDYLQCTLSSTSKGPVP